MTKDWIAWHLDYEDQTSSLSQRLAVVTSMARRALDAAAPGDIRVLSLCAGEARDLAGAAWGHPRATDLVGAVVEFDPELARRASIALAVAAPRIEVRCADAGDPSAFADVGPVDLVLLVGIFGNITDADIHNTIARVPSFCRPGGTVIWTRHRREPDLTGSVREWFHAAGFRSQAFESAGAGKFAVGVERYGDIATVPLTLGSVLLPPERLFTFSQ